MINRNNYEEYLMRFIDGELSSAERQAVDSFLEVNPDLEEEFQLLQQTVLQPEEVIFTGKETLYKGEAGINKSNFEDYFLLYVDGELNETQQQDVETFVLQNPGLQEAFTLLKQAVLPAEEIIFTNKETLYRKEEKRRPVVISMRWASLAAAIMIGVIAMVWVVNSGNKTSEGQQVAAKPQPQPQIIPGVTIKPGEQKINPEVNSGQAPLVAEGVHVDPHGTSPATQQRTPQLQVAVVQKQDVPQQTIEPAVIASTTRQENTVNYPGTSTTSGSNEDPVTKTASPDENSGYVQPAVYREELNTDEEEKSKSVLVGALQINPDKVRGLFRKAGRFLSNKVKSNNDDGDKVRIANIEVNKLK
jgi:hypothetical protein